MESRFHFWRLEYEQKYSLFNNESNLCLFVLTKYKYRKKHNNCFLIGNIFQVNHLPSCTKNIIIVF